jgi:hypothetical protein
MPAESRAEGVTPVDNRAEQFVGWIEHGEQAEQFPSANDLDYVL